jgi:hypothetical protein
MGNINAPTIEYYESFANEMQGKFRRVSQLTTHRPSSGDYHEEIIRNILRNFLSKRFSVKTGFIFGEQGVSSQIDIMIVDENEPMAYIFQEGDFAIVMPKAVVATIEVKTDINLTQFNECITKIAQVKEALEFPTSITSILFSFDGGTNSSTTLGNWLSSSVCQQYKDKKQLAPNMIMFFSKEVMLLPYSDAPGHSPSPGKYKKIVKNGENSNLQASHLSIMLALIVNSCISKNFRDTHYFPTEQADKLIREEQIQESQESFHLGEGLIPNSTSTG